MAEAAAPQGDSQSLFRALRTDRTLQAMFLFALAAGLPYAILAGTITAWFTSYEVSVSTIGVLSWITLAYAFKFLWSPGLHRTKPLFFARLGLRRAWILGFQFIIVAALGSLAFLSPVTQLGWIALAALIGAAASASQDIVIDAWRIESARDDKHLDAISAVYQFGYRGAGLIGGMLALFLSDIIGWPLTLGFVALTMAAASAGALIAREPKREIADDVKPTGVSLGGNVSVNIRNIAVLAIIASWIWAFYLIGDFMVQTLVAEDPPSARTFTRESGVFVVAATVLFPALVGALLLHLDRRASRTTAAPWPGQATADTLYRSILEPLMDLIQRLAWAAPLVLLLVLSYRFTDLIWGSFAYPFYMGLNFGALGHTASEVAIASKTIGVLMTFTGAALGGLALAWLGRMSCLIIGAVGAAATNLLFFDLAIGAPVLGGLLEFTRLYDLFGLFGADERLSRLILAIAGENIAVGFASVVFVAYLSSIVNPRFATVQYALLASLTMLIGTLGRAEIGQLVEERGFAFVFILTALMGLVAVAASVGEALRRRFAPSQAERDAAAAKVSP